MRCARGIRRGLADVPARRQTDCSDQREACPAARFHLGVSHAAIETPRVASGQSGHGIHAGAGALRGLDLGGRRCSLLHKQGRRPDRLSRCDERQDAVGVHHRCGREPHPDVLRRQGLRWQRRRPRLLPRCQDRQGRVGLQGRARQSLALLIQPTDVRVDHPDEHLCRQGSRILRRRHDAPRRHVHHGPRRRDRQDRLEE